MSANREKLLNKAQKFTYNNGINQEKQTTKGLDQQSEANLSDMSNLLVIVTVWIYIVQVIYQFKRHKPKI